MMALCAFAFPGSLNKAVASESLNNSLFCSNWLYGSDLLSPFQSKNHQVRKFFAFFCFFPHMIKPLFLTKVKKEKKDHL